MSSNIYSNLNDFYITLTNYPSFNLRSSYCWWSDEFYPGSISILITKGNILQQDDFIVYKI